MFTFSLIAQLILNGTVEEYRITDFMHLICYRAYREYNGEQAPDENNFGKWVRGAGNRNGPKIVTAYYRDPCTIEWLAEDIELQLMDSLSDPALLMEGLELALDEEVRSGFLSAKRKRELLSGSIPTQLARLLQFAITKRGKILPTESPDIGMYFCNTGLPRSDRPFVGRERELEQIKKRLEKDSILFLTGIRGAGKSGLAQEYARRTRGNYKNCVYIRYRRSFRETILSLEMAEDMTEGMTFRCRMDLLKKLKSDTLLLLDGMETLPEDDESFYELMNLNCHVLVTTYLQTDENTLFLGMMQEERDLWELFLAYCPEELIEDQADVMELIRLVHRHTYALIMLALTVKSGCITAGKLVDFIVVNGLGFPNEIKIRTVKDGKRLRKPFFELLKGLFVVQALTQEQQDMLCSLTCIPLWGMEKRTFLSWSKTSPGALCDLICLGWVQEEDSGKSVVVQGLVREMVIELLHPSVSVCHAMIRSVLNECHRYEDMDTASYKDHHQLDQLSECLAQTMTAVREHSEECVLFHTQMSICSYRLVIRDRAALLREHWEKMKRTDQMIVFVRICKAVAGECQKAQEYLAMLNTRLKERCYRKGLACGALYEETEHLLREEMQNCSEFVRMLTEERTYADVQQAQALINSLTEAERRTILLLGNEQEETCSRVEFSLPEECREQNEKTVVRMLRAHSNDLRRAGISLSFAGQKKLRGTAS